MIWKVFWMFVFVINVFWLNFLRRVVILFIELYVILEFFFGIIEFIELFFGKDKLWMIWNFFGFDFGIIFNGEEINWVNGGEGKGLVILFNFLFWVIKFCMIEGCLIVFLWLREIFEFGRFVYFKWKLYEKFFCNILSFFSL